MSNLIKKEKGFTLIEVVLVLAIAALLLVIVFLAVSGAQKSRRDTQRKEDLSRIAASLETFASNANGAYPTAVEWPTFWTQYVASDAKSYIDPLAGVKYKQGAAAATAGTPEVATGAAPSSVTYGISGRTYNVCIGVEQGLKNCRTTN